MVKGSDAAFDRDIECLHDVNQMRKSLRVRLNINWQLMRKFSTWSALICRKSFDNRQRRFFGFRRLESSYIALIIGSSSKICREILGFRRVYVGALAFLIVSCSPKATVEPDRAVPIEAPILPAASFSTLRPESPDETRLPEPYIEKGSGDYITSKAEIGVSPGQTGGKNLSLNFVDIEIRELLDKVLGDQLNLDYIIDPKVDGRITVRTSDELPSDDILSILDSVLNLNGAALVEDGGLYKVLPIDEVISSGITPEIRKVDNVGRFGFGVEIVPIKYISIEKLPELLQPILSNDSTIQINSQRNTALLVGPRQSYGSPM